MTLTLKSALTADKVLPLLRLSIQREIDYLNIGLTKTAQRLQYFSAKYQAPAPEKADRIPPLDLIEWEGEAMTLAQLQEKINIEKKSYESQNH